MSEYNFTIITMALGHAYIDGKITEDEHAKAIALLEYAADCVYRYEGLE